MPCLERLPSIEQRVSEQRVSEEHDAVWYTASRHRRVASRVLSHGSWANAFRRCGSGIFAAVGDRERKSAPQRARASDSSLRARASTCTWTWRKEEKRRERGRERGREKRNNNTTTETTTTTTMMTMTAESSIRFHGGFVGG